MFTKISNNRLAAEGTSSSQVTSVLDSILANAKKFGVLPATFAKELIDRESIITQMLITIPDEDKIVKYFSDFLFVNKVPWSKTRDLMSKALTAPSSGADVESVLDFALVHYVRKHNISQTKSIIDEGLKLQNSSRLTNIFDMLTDALENKPISMTGLQFSPDNVKDIFVFNRLVALSLNKNEEDTEMLRRSYVEALDELERTREVDDRYKAIFQMLQSNELAIQLTNITEFVTRMFELSINDPVLLAFRRVMIQLRIGVEFRKQFFSDVESNKTSEGPLRDTSGDRTEEDKNKEFIESLKTRFSSEYNYNFVKLADTVPVVPAAGGTPATPAATPAASQPSIPVDMKDKISGFLSDTNATLTKMIEKLSTLKAGLEAVKNNPTDPAYQGVSSVFIKAINPCLNIVNEAITKINALKSKVSTLNPDNLYEEFNKIWETMGANLVTKFKELTDGLDLPSFDDIKEFAAKLGIQPELLDNLFTGIIAAEAVFSGNLKTLLIGSFSLFAANRNITQEKLRVIVGKPVPKSTGTIDTQTLGEILRNLNIRQDQINDLIALKAYADAVKATIADRENTLVSKMTTAVKTNSDAQINAPLASNKEIQQEYSRFYEYLKEVNYNLNYYMDLIDTVVKLVRSLPENEKSVLQKTGPLLQQRASVEALITDVRSKLAKYKYFKLTAYNVQKRNRLMMDLQVLIPELEKYMATGISIADLFLTPGGLASKMKEISDSLIEDRDKIYAEMQKLKKVQKIPIRFKQVPVSTTNTPAPSNKPAVGENTMPDSGIITTRK
jgi:hypothetical protein